LWSILLYLAAALILRAEAAFGLSTFRFASPAWRVAAVALFVLSVVLGLASCITLATHGPSAAVLRDYRRVMVVAGPYRYLRNPMTLAALGMGAAVGLYFGSASVLACVLAGLLMWNFGVRPRAEADLEQRFGATYGRYRRRVRCWRPRLVGYDPARESALPPVALERTTAPGRFVLLYDGHCSFCRAQVRNLVRLARPGAIDAVDFQQVGVLDRFPGISYEACMRNMHLVTPSGGVYFGFEAAVRALATRPLLGLLAFTYYVPGIRLCCDLAYAGIAANRYRLTRKAIASGLCEEGTCHLHFPDATRRQEAASQ
jgi:protein-S-isoprenylcysteine O-methyltransferase Ste14/predicted DCC family thiol-disulfide oxidoreductase YuxK